jgi:transcriptional regulator of NAD metabolism
MYSEEEIRIQFGEESLNYLRNKNRGGISSEKGNTYENFFAVYQLAVLSERIIEHRAEISFASQVLAFVDDLIIDSNVSNIPLQHYQLKNSADVSWGQGLKSIADDFRKQQQLNLSINRQSDLRLVVSNPQVKRFLERSHPKDLKSYSQVDFFSASRTLIQVIRQDASFLEAIKYLCAFENPAPDKIECVANVLLGAWVACDKSNIPAIEILKKAQQSSPSFIRALSTRWKIDEEVKQILDNIDNFSYNFVKGFLHWQFGNGLEEGTFAYSCDTERYRQFESLIKRQKPKSYEELEVFLI